jgi:DNA (cytosine-5)-methyltransferase 1
MLILSRKKNEAVIITVGDQRIRVTLVAIRGDKVRLGFDGPKTVTIHRTEIQERVDVICGGFPCQDISRNGLQSGVYGKRSGLFQEFIRIIREIGPRVAVLENVAALLDGGIGEVLWRLAESGFNAEWDVLPACAFGADQIRERVFILAYAEHSRMERRRGANRAGPQMLFRSGVCQFKSSGGTFKTDQALSAVARYQTYWHREPDVGRVANGVSDRTHRLRGLGNAVVPQVAEWIGKRIVEAVQ